jgi:hypothetical protein
MVIVYLVLRMTANTKYSVYSKKHQSPVHVFRSLRTRAHIRRQQPIIGFFVVSEHWEIKVENRPTHVRSSRRRNMTVIKLETAESVKGWRVTHY